jgi:predicted metalloprotease with PDZ domain
MFNNLKFEITRDENADAGYTIADIIINETNYIVIADVKEGGPAFNAGLKKEHISWSIVSVNDINCSTTKQIQELIKSTKKPNYTFSIEIQDLKEQISNNNSLSRKKEKTTYTRTNLTTGDLYNVMWRQIVNENPEYEQIKDNSFRHAMLGCTTKHAQQMIFNQYLELNK